MMIYDEAKVERIRFQYPAGTRIELHRMDDPYTTLRAGDKGTVIGVDDAAQILMKWDNGLTLSLIPGEDSFSKAIENICENDDELEL